MPKICFCVPHAYALFEPHSQHPFGGSEVQSWLLAKGLSRIARNDVSFIVLDHKQAAVRRFGEIKVYKHSFYTAYPKTIDRYREEISGIRFKQAGFPWIALEGKTPFMFYQSLRVRLYDFRLALLHRFQKPLYIESYEIMADQYRVLKKVNADIYVASGVHETAAEVAAFCQHFGKKFVLLAASDYDFSPEHAEGSWQKDRYNSFGHLCHYAIQQADAIVTQTRIQYDMLKERFGRESTIITNPVDFEQMAETTPYSDRPYALWIGKADRVKRPDLLIELASRFPDIRFEMVMNTSHADIFDDIHQHAPVNVHLVDFVPYDRVETLFADAFAFINTSDFEGFPNAFLQAGKYGVPILSLNADPDGFIERYECGISAHADFEKLVQGLLTIRTDPAKAGLYSENIRAYVKDNHALSKKANQLNQVFETISD